jgi:hypothetical protein
MAIAFVQSKGTGTTTGPASLTYTSSNTVGNFLLLEVFNSNGGGTPPVPTDSQGNTWNLAIEGTDDTSAIYYAMNCKAGANTVTPGSAWTTVVSPGVAAYSIYEFSGIVTASALDKTGFSAASNTPPTITPTSSTTGDLIFASNNANTEGSPVGYGSWNTSGLWSTGLVKNEGYPSGVLGTIQDGYFDWFPGSGSTATATWTYNEGAGGSSVAYGDAIIASFFAATYATVTTQAATSITATTATANGDITNLNSSGNATVEGVVYNTTTFSPVLGGTPSSYGTVVSTSGSFGTGTFTESLTGLTANTTYYYAAFATNSAGASYGAIVSFTTALTPAILYHTTPFQFGFGGGA